MGFLFSFLFYACLLFAEQPVPSDIEPNFMINQMVCPVSGALALYECDATALALEPLTIDRVYSSGNGWTGGHHGEMTVALLGATYEIWNAAHYIGPYHQNIYFYAPHKDLSYDHFKFNEAMIELGLTNVTGSEISGRSNLKNCRLKPHGKQLELITGSGQTIRLKEGKTAWYVHETIFPTSHRLSFKHDEKGKILEAQSITQNGKSMATAEYHHKEMRTVVTLSNKAKVIYSYDKKQRLHTAERSNSPNVHYDYDPFNNLLIRRRLPEGRFVEFEYYPFQYADVGVEAPVSKRIKAILSPALRDGKKLATHTFEYDFPGPNKVKTTVADAKGHKTVYHAEGGRIQAIHRLKENNKGLYTVERFKWGAIDSRDGGNLLSRTLEDGHGHLLFKKEYEYDAQGNVIEEKLKGNMTGKGGDKKVTRNRYSSAKNLLSEKVEGNKRTEYFYHKDTDLIAKRLLWVEGALKERRFFEYDENKALVREMVDDGTSVEKNNLQGVTERRIHVKIYGDSTTGLPEAEEERYLDVNSGEERLLIRKVFQYDRQGKVTREKVYDAEGAFAYERQWEYNTLGCCIWESDPLGTEVKREFDNNLNLIKEKWPLFRQEKRYHYDLMNRLVRIEDEHADQTLTSHIQYNRLGHKECEIDCYGNETHYTYDCHGREIKVALPQGVTQQKTYDPLGFVSSITDSEGRETQIASTLYGKPIHKIYADGTEECWEYDLEGDLVRHKAVNGLMTVMTRDWQGRPTQTQIFDGHGTLLTTERATYNTFHKLSEIDAEGRVTTFSYDGAGRLVLKEKEGITERLVYDALGRISEKHSGDLLVEKFRYDLLGRVIEEERPGLIIQRTFDARGQMTQETKGNLTTLFFYNSKGELTEKIEPNNRRTYSETTHKKVKKIKVTEPSGHITETVYDALGRESEIHKKDPLGHSLQKSQKTYDRGGHLTKITHTIFYAGQREGEFNIAWEYDPMGRPTAIIEAQGTADEKILRFAYNAKGEKERYLKPDGVALHYTYDPFGRVKEEKSSDGSIHYVYHYNNVGQVMRVEDLYHHTMTEKSYDRHGELVHERLAHGLEVKNSYDTLGRVTSIAHDAFAVEYLYDATFLRYIRWKGHEIAYREYDTTGKLLEGARVSYVYDELGRLKQWRCGQYEENCSYDSRDNLTRRTLWNAEQALSYDALNQLTQEGGISYSYDSNFNRRSKNGERYTLNGCQQVLSAGSLRCEWDKNGNLIAKIENDQRTEFKYDARDRLIEVKWGEKVDTYFWDEQNRRLKKNEMCFLYQGNNEVGSANEFRILGVGKGAEIGASVLLERQGEIYQPLHDAAGNLIALLDTSGELVEKYDLTAFGEETSGHEALSPWRFSSKRHDAETGFVLFGRRFYDPTLGRFITADPLGYSAGPNLYQFCTNAPLTHFDLYGLETTTNFTTGCRDFFDNVRAGFNTACEWIQERWSRFSDSTRDCLHSLGHSLQHGFSRIGSGIEASTKHLIFPLNDVGGATGHFFKNGCLCSYTPTWCKNHTTLYYLDGHDHGGTKLPAILNGVCTPGDDLFTRMHLIHQQTNGGRVYGIHVETHGFMNDMMMALIERMGFISPSSRTVQAILENLITKAGPDCVLEVQAFSRGNLVLINVGEIWRDTGKTYGQNIKATLMATPRVPPKGLFKETSCTINTADCIMLVDPLGTMAAKCGFIDNHFVPTETRFPFGHSYEDPSYRAVQKRYLDFINQRSMGP